VALLRTFFPDRKLSENLLSNASGWALERITGEALPAPVTIRRVDPDWFLRPAP
jgi:hypothetical protein